MANIRTALFSEKLLSSHFFIVIPLTLQLLFRSNYFFRVSAFYDELLFQNRHFSAAVIFSEQLFFQSEISTKQPSLENRKIFRVASFRNGYFFGKGIVQNKNTEELLFRSSYFCTASTISEELHFGKKAICSEKQYSALATFSGELPFQRGFFFKRRYFLQQLPFRKGYFFSTYYFGRVAILQLPFLSTATLLIYQLVINYYQLRTAQVQELFLVYLLLLEVTSTKFI